MKQLLNSQPNDNVNNIHSINSINNLTNLNQNNNNQMFSQQSLNTNLISLGNYNKVSVPPGAKSSLEKAGLTNEQIDALAALIAQHKAQQILPLLKPNIKKESTILLKNDDDSDSTFSNLNNISKTYTNSNYSTAKVAADLDKRRRNTAASARFRIKKKLKEQQLERNLKELKELSSTLEIKIKNLTMENNLLKNLIFEKNLQKSNHELELLKKKALDQFTNTNETKNDKEK
ncbi:bZIP transcription factor ASCRUDRAFT_39274 [Ascoidea rubescens DSM 1968]|uniref:BZIP domain-containing protein n=1 Tax=Ascoidea rubescens DSM 1968 TaxID=1344418 RepID=A0A1D2V9X6_9ASCO|nr:hypothetical protein ASCRUDRAFT_39274 [Ascoidea rubescens DSM 1968]ODV58438.1 hypothetical protein ASCRUDRAFT_39274 [Ascoidea rubescens DSM 1968]